MHACNGSQTTTPEVWLHLQAALQTSVAMRMAAPTCERYLADCQEWIAQHYCHDSGQLFHASGKVATEPACR